MGERNELTTLPFPSYLVDLTELIEESRILEAAAKKLIRELECHTSKVCEWMARVPR
jgi:hypothetical protein